MNSPGFGFDNQPYALRYRPTELRRVAAFNAEVFDVSSYCVGENLFGFTGKAVYGRLRYLAIPIFNRLCHRYT
jgi:hypothetical protein